MAQPILLGMVYGSIRTTYTILTLDSDVSSSNPRRACAARVTVVVLCVSVHGSNLLVAQLCDKLVILTGSVSWSLQNKFGVFRIMASFLYLRAHCSRPFLYVKRAHFPHSFRILRS